MYAAPDPFAEGDLPDPQVATPEPSPRTSPITFPPDVIVSSYCNPLRRPGSAWSDDGDQLADPCDDDDDEDDPTNPTTRLLGKDFTQVLRSVAQVVGRKKNPAVLLSFDGLDLRAPTDGVRGALLRCVPWLRPPLYPRAALDNVSGSFRPQTLSLVLGPPLSGKSALLKALAGRLSSVGVTSQFRGSVSYAGRPLYPLHRHKKGEVVVDKLLSFIPQDVDFIPTLSARQTVQFAQAIFQESSKKQLLAEGMMAEECQQLQAMQNSYSEMLLQRMGLEPVANMPVVALTDGQRRLLSCVEGFTLQAPVVLADGILTGVDGDNAYRLCAGIKLTAREKHRTAIVAQSFITPEVFDIFDDLTLMSGGHIVYQGSRTQVVEYFQRLGFQCPAGLHAADFVQDLLQPGGPAKYRAAAGPASEDLAQLWRSSEMCRDRATEDLEYGKQSASELAQLPTAGFHHRKFAHRYTCGLWRGTVICTKRQWFLTYGNKPALVVRLFILLFVSFVLGSLFFDLHSTDYNAKMGVIFYAMMVNSMAFSAIPAIVASRRILYREMAANFYHPVSHATAGVVTDIPIGAVETIVFCLVTYWMCAFSPVGSDFFVFTCVVFLVKLGMVAFFRLLGLMSPTDVLGTGLAAIAILLLLLHTGYAIGLEDIKPWWVWVYWINPLQYGLTAMTLAEFHSNSYTGLKDPADPSAGTWGNYYLTLRKLSTDQGRMWSSFVFLVGFPFVIFVLNCLALAYVRWPDPTPTPPPPAAPLPAVMELQPDLPGDEEQPAGEEAPLPVEPCTVAWRGVTYRPAVPGKKGKLGPQLLSDISGFARPGELTLIIGENGSGKTLLLEVIGGRRTLGSVEGAVLLNGRPADAALRRRVVGLASRATCHSLQTTVGEALKWSASLCLPREVAPSVKHAHIERLAALFGLASISGYQIGSLAPALLAVVTLAVELAANPAVVLLDGLTTGLDWAALQRLLPALRALRQDGRALVLAAHQPSRDLLALVDTLVVLRGGRVMCCGDATFGCAEVIDFLHTIPEVPRYQPEQNPVHWILSLFRNKELDVAEEYEHSELCAANTRRLEAAASDADVAPPPAAGPHKYQTSLPMQFALLLRKWGRLHWRCHAYNWSRVVTSVILGLVIGSSFWRIHVRDQQSAFSLVSVQYLSLVFMAFTFMNTVQGVVARERSVYYCDKARHMYSPWILNGVMALWEALYVCFNCLLCVVIFYPMVGLNSDGGIIVFWYWNFALYILFATYFGLFCGLFMPLQDLVLVLMGVLTTLFSLMTGYLLPRLQIPWWWRWVHYGVPLPYTFQIATSIQLFCEAADKDWHTPGDCATFPLVSNGHTIQYPLWPAVRDRFYLTYSDRWMYLGIIFAFLGIVHLLTGLVLAKVDHGKR
eukprot:EG_transcript_273